MTNRVVYFNGEWILEHQARVSFFDSGYLYGETAFEMTRTFQGVPFRMREHLERLFASLQFLDIDCGLTLDELEQLTLETLRRNQETEPADVDWHLRHDISRGPAELYAPAFHPAQLRPTVLISCWPLVRTMGRFAANYTNGVRVVICPQRSLPQELIDPRAKTRSRVHFQLAQNYARRVGGNVWPVLTDAQGFLTEGPSWNILVLKDRTLYSPRGTTILHGISREITFQAAREIGLQTAERDLSRDFVLTADEIYCTATSFGMVPVVEFDGHPVGSGQPGPVFEQLMRTWKRIVGCGFVSQAQTYAARLSEWEASERDAANTRKPEEG